MRRMPRRMPRRHRVSTAPPILLASNNPHKREEIVRALGAVPVMILVPSDIGIDPPKPVEDGASYRENAERKARAFSLWSGLAALADDSGLEVAALAGEPGLRSARYAGENSTDAENLSLLLGNLEGVRDADRAARFVCVLALAVGAEVRFTAEGACRGRIGQVPKGARGLGYDPIFIPNGESATFAAMDPARKDRISHRGIAVSQLGEALRAGRLSLAMPLGR